MTRWPDLVAGHAGAKCGDDADRLVADDATGSDRIFTLQNMYVGPTDRRRRDAKERVRRADLGNRPLLELNVSGRDKDGGFHRGAACQCKSYAGRGEREQAAHQNS